MNSVISSVSSSCWRSCRFSASREETQAMQDINHRDFPQHQQADTNEVASSAQDTFKREAQSAGEAPQDARDEVTRKVGEYAAEAKAAAVEAIPHPVQRMMSRIGCG